MELQLKNKIFFEVNLTFYFFVFLSPKINFVVYLVIRIPSCLRFRVKIKFVFSS